MRREPTPFEAKLWQALRGLQLGGLKFSRQVVIDGHICDFVCRDRTLIVEVDGDTHEAAADADRDYVLGRLGYETLRFTNGEVRSNLGGVLSRVLEVAGGRRTKLQRLDGLTRPPTPSLGREGEA